MILAPITGVAPGIEVKNKGIGFIVLEVKVRKIIQLVNKNYK